MEVGADELRLVTSAHDSLYHARQVSPRHLNKLTLFLRKAGSSTRAGAESMLGEMVKEFGRVVEISSTEAIKQSVISGLGVSALSSWATKLEEDAGLLKPVRDARFRQQRRLYLVRRRDRALKGAAAALWECLLTCQPHSAAKTRRRNNGRDARKR